MTEIITTDGLPIEQDQSYYGDVSDGDFYFNKRLNSNAWKYSPTLDKISSLIQATEIIDRLNFKGQKTDSTQDLQFPRGSDTEVPRDILRATYEIALRLLDDVDTNLERDNLGTQQHIYDHVRTTYNRTFLLPHIVAGVPSAIAWDYLRPYLRPAGSITLRRVN